MINNEQIAAMSVQFVQYSLDYTIDAFAKCGIKNLEFWGAEPHYYRLNYLTRYDANKRLRQIRNQLHQSGIKVVMYTPETLAYPYSFSSPEEKVRNRTAEFFDMCCNDALELGCNRIFINTGCGLRDVNLEASWNYTVESIQRICEISKRYGVELVLEQLQPYESNLVTSLKDIKKMLSDVQSENLKVCLDVVAMEVAGDTIQDFFNQLGETIVHIHLADQNHEILGDGNYPIIQYLDYLSGVAYDQYISLEINDSIYWEDPYSSLKQSMDYLKSRYFDRRVATK
ncbi:sugar phosphate isomerase/epimerase family protein [Bacillus massilinigeriensis]|uniref:sugar phosphate isomerase/epimerase family protein n=1 Tax=Bacillus massilionigeriensis TaxID=1805475 RepID=UPI00096B1DEF|nr:TIM barrel protein [Bacillus massilionigeriensis]